MAYENTHLFFADQARKHIPNASISAVIASYTGQYYLGSIFPDTLSYSRKRKISHKAGVLHGGNGSPTYQFVTKMLDYAKSAGNKKSLSFILGYLTHCALDTTVHPAIIYFSGFKPDGNKRKLEKYSYLHWHFETYFDRLVNNSHYVDKMVRPEYLEGLEISKVLNIPGYEIRKALSRQIRYFKHTHHKIMYRIYTLLSLVKLVPKTKLGGFYSNLETEKETLPELIKYRDLITGDKKQTTPETIMRDAGHMVVHMIEGAYAYWEEKINKDALQNIITGRNLNTGHFGKTKKDIQYSRELKQ